MKEAILRELEKLISDAHRLIKTVSSRDQLITDRDGVRRWSNHLLLFKALAGRLAAPWSKRISHNGVALTVGAVEEPLGALEMMKYALDEGLLTSFEELVYAEAFSDLYQQGEYLLEQGYFLAAGVIFRAVLEERLRRMCDTQSCMPLKARPTINDLNQSLYTADPPAYDKAMMLHVYALAAVGNNAAHNSPDLTIEDVQRLKSGLLAFLSKFAG